MVSGVYIVLLGFKTHKGMVRKNNEDRYLVRDLSPCHLLAVADGMGGHNAGDVASSMAIEFLEKYSFECLTLEEIEGAIHEVNHKIFTKSIEDPMYLGMGTTLTISIIKENCILLGHVGDSRAYMVDEDGMRCLTTDHSLVNELLKTKEITEEESIHHPLRHVLSQAVGTERDIHADYQYLEIQNKTTILLCTDGLTNHVPEEEIEVILRDHEPQPQRAADELVARANHLGGQDNITAIVCALNYHYSQESDLVSER